LFSLALSSQNYNTMKLASKEVAGRKFFVPKNRMDMIKDALVDIYRDPSKVTIYGPKETFERIAKVFPVSTNSRFGVGIPSTTTIYRPSPTFPTAINAKYDAPHTVYNPHFPPPYYNKGSAHVDGGYSQDGGWHVDAGATFSWAKQQEEANKGSAHFGGGYSQDGGWHAEGGATFSWAKEQQANKGSAHIDGGYSQDGGWHVDGGFSISWAKQQENKGSAHVDGGYSQDGGWHVDGGVSFEWAKQQQQANKPYTTISHISPNECHGSVSVSGGYSSTGGAYGSVSVSISFAKDGEEPLYITEVATPEGYIYLPTYTPGKFDNLEKQLLSGEAIFA